MARDEVDRFEKYLEEKRSYRMLTEYIKMTYNEFYYCNLPSRNDRERSQHLFLENTRKIVMEKYKDLALKYGLKFELEIRHDDVIAVDWVLKDKSKYHCTGFKKFLTSNIDLKPQRNPIPAALRHEVFRRDGYRCVECGASNNEATLEVDHIIPVIHGGSDELSNLQTLCLQCNRAKGTRTWKGAQRNILGNH